MKKLPVQSREGARQNGVGGVGDDLRLARALDHLVAAEQIADGGGGDGGLRPERIHRDAIPREVLRESERHEAHAIFRHRIREIGREPFRVHVERRRQGENMRVLRLAQIRQSDLGAEIGSARIDLMHQIEALHVELVDPAQIDGAGVVDENVDAAENIDRLFRSPPRPDRRNVCRREWRAPCRLRLRSPAPPVKIVPGSFGIFRHALGGDGDIGAVARRALRNGEADAAARAGDEKRLALKRACHGGVPLCDSSKGFQRDLSEGFPHPEERAARLEGRGKTLPGCVKASVSGRSFETALPASSG